MGVLRRLSAIVLGMSVEIVMLLFVSCLPASAQTYDLVINNGRIVIITKDKIIGQETIDATGLVVAPGIRDAGRGYSGKDCGKILGGNLPHLFKHVWR